jgi:alkanesulfonate monooxygenase SsuD/methylene tetrahydromethanopterin reductase-like flavin-dependent oxidoreductase (luciferase family)
VEFGAHLPLISFDDSPKTLARLREYASAAAAQGYTTLCANDHLLFTRPWLDGPTALASVIDEAEEATLATTVCLPVIRGPLQTAKALATIDILSGGRLVAGVGAGSSARDYAAVGVPFDDRWSRFEEAAQVVRALLDPARPGFEGRYYSTKDVVLEPAPGERPPVWVGSWGSKPGIRRVARIADGWLASAYNTTPDVFRASLSHLDSLLEAEGRDAAAFPNGLVTAWLYVTESPAVADRVLTDVLAPMLRRPVETLRELSLPIGPAEVCAERIAAFARAGVQRFFVWPLGDELEQLELFRNSVVPVVSDTSGV